MRIRVAWIVGLSLGLALESVAQPAQQPADKLNNGLYLELQGGGSFFQDADLHADTGVETGSGEAQFDTGWTAGGAIGFRAFSMLRLEAHGSWRMADFDELRVEGLTLDADDAFAGAATFLGNAYFDIPLPIPLIHPYVGGGAGVAIFTADVDDNSVDVDDDDLQFAWNAMGGVFIPIFRHLELDVRYRYITSEDPEIDAEFFGLDDGTVKAEFESHEVVGALRVVF
jgi:opacity protein-like surface antigen